MSMGKVLPTATASHQPQSAGSDRRLDEFNRRCVMLHAAGTWAMPVATLNHLQLNDGSVLSRQWIKAQTPFLSNLGIRDLDVVLHTSRVRWFEHVECSTGWVAEVWKTNCSCTEETRQV